ncbi:sensor histidine kinase [Nonomuraea sp. NPDC049400]|uniref:sensor histidine kinase n=1 Tax=Nonomuraea sp. NPDC049400 TaxID=3364352 RepID=UPI0037A3148B
MVTEHTHREGRLRRPLAALSRLTRLGDVPVVVMLAWAGWLAVPWSFSGLAQARAAAAAAAAEAEPPQVNLSAESVRAWAIPAAPPRPLTTVRPTPTTGDGTTPASMGPASLRAGSVAASSVAASSVAAGSVAAGSVAAGSVGPASVEPASVGLSSTGAGSEGQGGNASPGVAVDGSGPAQAALRHNGAATGTLDVGGAVWGGPGAGGLDVVAAERARIAGEVHDAAGHGLAAIAMQAGLALVALDDDPEQARESLRAIRETSTTALAQLRAALDGIDPPGGDLARLIDGVRAAGLPVDVEPADFTVPVRLQGTVYRVVRESLTNVLRHAGPTRALVRVGGHPGEFLLEVADRGAGWTGAREGRGLAGMRAHVTEAGGHFAVGPRDGGGFQVIARFPQVST